MPRIRSTAAWLTTGPDATAGSKGSPDGMFSARSEEHTSELQSLMRISYAVLRLKQQNIHRLLGFKEILFVIFFVLKRAPRRLTRSYSRFPYPPLFRADIGVDGWRDVVALTVAPVASGEERRARRLRPVDHAEYPVDGGLVDHGSRCHGGVEGVAGRDVLRDHLHPRDDLVIDVLVHEHPGGEGAALTGEGDQ